MYLSQARYYLKYYLVFKKHNQPNKCHAWKLYFKINKYLKYLNIKYWEVWLLRVINRVLRHPLFCTNVQQKRWDENNCAISLLWSWCSAVPFCGSRYMWDGVTVFLQENCGIWSPLSNCELRSDCHLNHLSYSRSLTWVHNVCSERTDPHVMYDSMCWRCFVLKCRNWTLREGFVFSSWMKLGLLTEHREQHPTCQGVGERVSGKQRVGGKQRFQRRNSSILSFQGKGMCVWIEGLRRKLRTSADHQDHIQTASPSRDQPWAAGWKTAGWSLFWWKQIHARRKYIP